MNRKTVRRIIVFLGLVGVVGVFLLIKQNTDTEPEKVYNEPSDEVMQKVRDDKAQEAIKSPLPSETPETEHREANGISHAERHEQQKVQDVSSPTKLPPLFRETDNGLLIIVEPGKGAVLIPNEPGQPIRHIPEKDLEPGNMWEGFDWERNAQENRFASEIRRKLEAIQNERTAPPNPKDFKSTDEYLCATEAWEAKQRELNKQLHDIREESNRYYGLK